MMRRRKHDPSEDGFEERVIERVRQLLREDLFIPDEEDQEDFLWKEHPGHGYDPDWYIDHDFIDDRGRMTQHPYSIGMAETKRLIKWCEENGYGFFIHGGSPYFPGRTIVIIFEKEGRETEGRKK